MACKTQSWVFYLAKRNESPWPLFSNRFIGSRKQYSTSSGNQFLSASSSNTFNSISVITFHYHVIMWWPTTKFREIPRPIRWSFSIVRHKPNFILNNERIHLFDAICLVLNWHSLTHDGNADVSLTCIFYIKLKHTSGDYPWSSGLLWTNHRAEFLKKIIPAAFYVLFKNMFSRTHLSNHHLSCVERPSVCVTLYCISSSTCCCSPDVQSWHIAFSRPLSSPFSKSSRSAPSNASAQAPFPFSAAFCSRCALFKAHASSTTESTKHDSLSSMHVIYSEDQPALVRDDTDGIIMTFQRF